MNRDERASATAETAVALPVLVLVLAACLWALSYAASTLRCADAARAAARAAARGELPAAVAATARRAAGRPVTVTTRRSGDLVVVDVSWRLRAGAFARRLPVLRVHQTATAWIEPRAGPP